MKQEKDNGKAGIGGGLPEGWVAKELGKIAKIPLIQDVRYGPCYIWKCCKYFGTPLSLLL